MDPKTHLIEKLALLVIIDARLGPMFEQMALAHFQQHLRQLHLHIHIQLYLNFNNNNSTVYLHIYMYGCTHLFGRKER